MNPVVAGLFIAAPLSAIMSTVSSLLILASAAIIKDIYLNYIVKDAEKKENDKVFEKKIGKMSIITTFIIGAIVFVFAIYPPDLIVWINLFAMGGLECAFLCPIVFGLYWKKANATGAIASTIIGVAAFLIISTTGFSLGGTTAIVPSIIITIIVFVVGCLIGKKPDEETLQLFFD
jgi:sodium/pantothenate symporter